MKRAGKTPPFVGPDGKRVRGSIAEISYLNLGGLDQWVMIRGESLANPPLIMLHGGPGLGETSFFRRFNAPLEKKFTVVYWDQRGAGYSYDKSIPAASMTLEQFLTDLDALVEAVRARLHQDRVILFGHSWGSLLGVLYAARFPEKVAAYVGSGQIGDWQAGEAASYNWVLGEAQRRQNRKGIEAMETIGPPPYDAKSLWTERMWLNRLEGKLRPRALFSTFRLLLSGPETSVFNLSKSWRAFRWSLDVMWPEVSRLNLLELAPALQVPVFFFLGRNDRWVPPDTSVAYFHALTAPSKRLVWFEESGHEPFMDEAAKFNALMIELVRPAVLPVGEREAAATV